MAKSKDLVTIRIRSNCDRESMEKLTVLMMLLENDTRDVEELLIFLEIDYEIDRKKIKLYEKDAGRVLRVGDILRY